MGIGLTISSTPAFAPALSHAARDVGYFICTEPLTVTDTVALPPSTAIGAPAFALSIAGAAMAIMRAYGYTLRPLPTFTSRIE